MNGTECIAIRLAMVRADVDQKELAAHMGMHQTSLSRKLRGQVPLTVDELRLAAEALGVTVSSLIGADEISA